MTQFKAVAKPCVLFTFAICLNLLYAAQGTAYSTVLGYPDILQTPGDYEGVYDSQEACLADLDRQKGYFKSATKLSPQSMLCQPAVLGSDPSYVMRVSARGQPRKFLFGADFGYGRKVDEAMEAAASKILANEGAFYPQVLRGVHFYYSRSALSVHRRNFGIFGVAGDCNQQVDAARAILEKAKARGSFVRCVPAFETKTMLEVLYAGPTLMGDDGWTGLRRYAGIGECLSDKPRALKQIAHEGAKPLGGICEPVSGSTFYYQLTVYQGL